MSTLTFTALPLVMPIAMSTVPSGCSSDRTAAIGREVGAVQRLCAHLVDADADDFVGGRTHLEAGDAEGTVEQLAALGSGVAGSRSSSRSCFTSPFQQAVRSGSSLGRW